MPKLPRVSGRKVISTLEKLGYAAVRQRGSHVVMKKKTTKGYVGCVVPLHRELANGTLNSVLKQAQLATEEFINALKQS